MSHRISAASSPSSAVFFNPCLWRLSQLSIADLFGDGDQLPGQLAEAMILVELFAGSLYGGASGNDVGHGLAGDSVSQ